MVRGWFGMGSWGGECRGERKEIGEVEEREGGVGYVREGEG